MRRLTITAIIGLTLVLAACSGGDTGSSTGNASDSTRTVTATMSDDMAIQLSETDFTAGQAVRFEITNEGSVRHEFYLGDAEAQEHHAAEMAEMGGMGHDEPNGVAVDPGATETLEYTFAEAGEILAGCHEPGHYESGMVASMTVAGE